MSDTDAGGPQPEVVTSDSRIDSAEDVRAWMVEDDDLRDEEDLEGAIFCNDCISSYMGDGTVYAVSHEGLHADVFCHECEVFLGDE